MNRRIAIAVTATALLLGLTACTDTDEVTTKPDSTAPAAASKAGKATPKAKATPKKVAGIGDHITVKGYEDGQQLDAVAKKVVDPAHSSNEFMTPAAGKRYLAVQFELTNTGTAVYSDSPSNGAQVADAKGQRFDATFADVTAGPSMTSSAQVPKGEKALGYIVFEVPKASKITTVQFAMNSGFADQTAQWKIG